jgi:two-component system nitrate/nitrite response regulator NarP
MATQSKRPIDVVIAEKNPLLQSSLLKLFSGDGRFHVMGVAGDGERFLDTIERLRCDVGVIGWEMPFTDGRGVLQSLRGKPPAPRIVVYTGSSNPDVPRQAMALGAAGFCSKNETPEHLLDTVAQVADGRMVFPFIDVARLVTDPLAGLTPRERELLSSLAAGLTNQQMAGQTAISLNTVKFHLKNLYGKLRVTNRAQAVAFYMKARDGR